MPLREISHPEPPEPELRPGRYRLSRPLTLPTMRGPATFAAGEVVEVSGIGRAVCYLSNAQHAEVRVRLATLVPVAHKVS